MIGVENPKNFDPAISEIEGVLLGRLEQPTTCRPFAMNSSPDNFNITIAGHTWGFLDDPPPATHIATVDRQHVIWLEDAGDRIWRPQTTLPRCEVVAVRHWIHEHRKLVERAWLTQAMMPNGWVDAYLVEEGHIVVEAYAGTLNWYGVVMIDDDIHVAVTGTDDITIDGNSGEMILGVRSSKGEQQRVDLAELFWRPFRPGS